ncbi:riboflavin biosynthesis protein RibF [Bacillus coahuilensis p1.1.43]|uniref:Bifunctional riboflavin kinase/FMN adenylyltransferase n=2 Tax=Bacillus coahuilensis TaxID=408580 RepID=A0A147K9P2_9BACI|nr:riboflavin biosynthesis protein RibF [Bacillus coahuilensis p1.1.43]
MTFDPHPSVVLGKEHKHVHYITPLKDKETILDNMGVDYLFVVRFTSDFASLLPQEFVDQYIIDFNVKHVVAGFDFSYGKLGKGTMETLPFHSREMFSQTTVTKLSMEDVKVSSTLLRESIQSGQMDKVQLLLGRPFETRGTVVHGEKRGRKIGFPTANIEISDDYLLPPTGVYTVQLYVQNEWHEGVCNVGYKPTFHNPEERDLSIEVHIFNFKRSIYGEEIILRWYQRIRSEKKFNGIDQLIEQIQQDKEMAMEFFRNSP